MKREISFAWFDLPNYSLSGCFITLFILFQGLGKSKLTVFNHPIKIMAEVIF